jgi:hypothetical protein
MLYNHQDQFAYYNAMAAYGITDWLEVGAVGQLVDRSNNQDNQSVMAGGPFVRARVMKDQGIWPELSIGVISLNGSETVERQTVFLAASKRFAISEGGPVKAFRLHLGGRQFWQTPNTDLKFKNWTVLQQRGPNDLVGYVGGELQLPKNIYWVSEVQTMETGGRYMPWSTGLQLRHPEGFGLSLALIQPGFSSSMAVYIGIGINFF